MTSGRATSLPGGGDLLPGLAFAAAAATVAGVIAGYHGGPWTGCATAAVAGAAAAWWRARPTLALLTGFAMYAADLVLGAVPTPVFLPLAGTFVAAVVFGRRQVAYAVLAAGYALAVVVPVPGWNAPSTASAAGLAAWFLVLAAAAEVVRVRRQARQSREAELAGEARTRQEQALRRAGDERLRIARDLHDVLAHQLALITVQANAGLALLPRDPRAVEQALTAIKDAGNSALGEVRAVLDALRAPEAGGAPYRPSPRLSRPSDLAELLDGARTAGLRVAADIGDPLPDLPALVDQAAYRIAQEAVTNAIRHAGAGATVRLRCVAVDDRLELTVTDDGGGHPASRALGGGNGLPGMRERAAAFGGALTAGPVAGGYRVAAVLPIGGAR
ncbi:sensor histidine kinase [Amycolatopsis benzoatilytica]|uniref:sensor histidine kinase n=1 Tax=Amycolatopsis benzoatilytica TaxID=346045 RepID=UPI0003A14384|nr:sensor histidine kinase [Amycolatopsis benzoatilytica]